MPPIRHHCRQLPSGQAPLDISDSQLDRPIPRKTSQFGQQKTLSERVESHTVVTFSGRRQALVTFFHGR